MTDKADLSGLRGDFSRTRPNQCLLISKSG